MNPGSKWELTEAWMTGRNECNKWFVDQNALQPSNGCSTDCGNHCGNHSNKNGSNDYGYDRNGALLFIIIVTAVTTQVLIEAIAEKKMA